MNQMACALRFSVTSKPVPVLDYIKEILSLVDRSHVTAVFEGYESLEVLFDDKRYADFVIRSGIHVMGRHVKIDYSVPPGIKVILKIDPVISNCDVLKLLSTYGAVVSPIIEHRFDDIMFCHIRGDVRYAYMVLNQGIPNKINFKYGRENYTVKARIEEQPEQVSSIDIEESEKLDYEDLLSICGITTDVIEKSDPPIMDVVSTVSESNNVQIKSEEILDEEKPNIESFPFFPKINANDIENHNRNIMSMPSASSETYCLQIKSEINLDEEKSDFDILPISSEIIPNHVEITVVSRVESTASETSDVQIKSQRSMKIISHSKHKTGSSSRKNLIMKRKNITHTSHATKRSKTE